MRASPTGVDEVEEFHDLKNNNKRIDRDFVWEMGRYDPGF